MKYDLKILVKLLTGGSYNQFFYLVEDLLDDKTIKDAAFFNLIGIYFQKIKKEKKALIYFNRSLDISPNTFQVLNNRGVVYFFLKKLDLAIEDFKKSMQLNPKNIETHIFLAKCYHESKNSKKAIKVLENCKNNFQPNLSVLDLLGKIYYSLKIYDKAKDVYLLYIKYNPNNSQIFNILGLCYENLFSYDLAIDAFNQGLRLDEKNIDLLCNLGNLKRSFAKFSEARDLYNKVIEVDMYQTTAHRYISVINKYEKNDLHLLKMLEIIKNKFFKKNELKFHEIYFALSKAFEDLKDYEKSVYYLLKGNKLRRETVNYNSIEIAQEHFECIKKIFSTINVKKTEKFSKFHPIFIVGMPRSGTTLTEQIIASHADVSSGGELTYIGDIIKNAFPYKDLNIFFDRVCSQLDKLSLEMSLEYFKLTEKISKNNFVTDKLPQNFMFIGFIKFMFPNCKIIHCQRNAKDTCMSIFKNYFPDNGIWYAYDEKELVAFYKLYDDLMLFWDKIFPKQIYNLRYEDMISNQKQTTENLLKYCELTWDENCLNFYKNSAPVKTLSTAQVRTSIYKSSVNKFELYQSLIPNFLNNLN